MKLGIMQPYFFPYIGYFELIAKTDKWVVFDTVDYTRKSWMTRNRILHPKEGWQYVSVPVDYAPRGTKIKDIKVKDLQGARDKLISQLQHYRNKAKYFDETTALVMKAFDSTETDSLTHLNASCLKEICNYLSLDFDCEIFSEMKMELPTIEHPGQWALEIADRLNATEYINPPGGKDIFRPVEWENRGISLTFTEHNSLEYETNGYEFIKDLSILDVLMWNNPTTIKEHLLSR